MMGVALAVWWLNQQINDEIWLRLPVGVLALSARPAKRLEDLKIYWVGELVQRSEGDLYRVRGFGQKSLREVKEALARMDLRLGMKIKTLKYSSYYGIEKVVPE